ncbi:metallophosphoesterase [Methylobacterium pseudosasicola]|uniref:Calcineurin-like phosphoesterase superfamily protein n=1 Tax=Methylobacterium pseudosasicola TaxID=582667 RepID=A0A1I4P6D3_9HYPH|nr:metallophosphoesterase [Methylobacterium pseudosasicola]SFM23341.1 Calcineurin-like phosphoesterase superfamily protein [Methylobacterium pseudosasicola]
MASRTLFSSDHHFGHRALLGERMTTRRPFSSVEEHDEALIANWNAAVGPEDTVWHLGDFCYRCGEDYARSVFARLRGRRRFLVRGNHDKIGARLPWDGILDVARVVVPGPDGAVQGVWLSHYAHRVWPRMHHGDLHFYGHSHGTLPGTAASTDVGVDCFGFRPVTLDEIWARLAENASVATGPP